MTNNSITKKLYSLPESSNSLPESSNSLPESRNKKNGVAGLSARLLFLLIASVLCAVTTATEQLVVGTDSNRTSSTVMPMSYNDTRLVVSNDTLAAMSKRLVASTAMSKQLGGLFHGSVIDPTSTSFLFNISIIIVVVIAKLALVGSMVWVDNNSDNDNDDSTTTTQSETIPAKTIPAKTFPAKTFPYDNSGFGGDYDTNSDDEPETIPEDMTTETIPGDDSNNGNYYDDDNDGVGGIGGDYDTNSDDEPETIPEDMTTETIPGDDNNNGNYYDDNDGVGGDYEPETIPGDDNRLSGLVKLRKKQYKKAVLDFLKYEFPLLSCIVMRLGFEHYGNNLPRTYKELSKLQRQVEQIDDSVAANDCMKPDIPYLLMAKANHIIALKQARKLPSLCKRRPRTSRLKAEVAAMRISDEPANSTGDSADDGPANSTGDSADDGPANSTDDSADDELANSTGDSADAGFGGGDLMGAGDSTDDSSLPGCNFSDDEDSLAYSLSSSWADESEGPDWYFELSSDLGNGVVDAPSSSWADESEGPDCYFELSSDLGNGVVDASKFESFGEPFFNERRSAQRLPETEVEYHAWVEEKGYEPSNALRFNTLKRRPKNVNEPRGLNALD